jgi:hypothetical protein
MDASIPLVTAETVHQVIASYAGPSAEAEQQLAHALSQFRAQQPAVWDFFQLHAATIAGMQHGLNNSEALKIQMTAVLKFWEFLNLQLEKDGSTAAAAASQG